MKCLDLEEFGEMPDYTVCLSHICMIHVIAIKKSFATICSI